MRIQQIVERTGFRKDTMRYWERFGLLRPARDGNGYRNYSEEDYRRVVLIGLGKEAGFTLQEIGALLNPVMREGFTFRNLSGILEAQLERIDRTIGDLLRTRARITHIMKDCPQTRTLKSAIFEDNQVRARRSC